MVTLIVATVLFACSVLGSPAVRRAELTAPTSTLESSPTTTSIADDAYSTFYWGNKANSSITDAGYYPERDPCPGLGTTCEEACGLGAVACGSETCYFPDLGDQCCSDTEMSCWDGYTCAEEVDTGTAFCCYGDDTEDECASIEATDIAFVSTLPNPTSSPASTGTSLIDRTTIDHTVYVTASLSSSTPVPVSTSNSPTEAPVLLSKPSSASTMTVGAKVGVGIGVPTAAIALGLLGAFVWFRAKSRRQSEQPKAVPSPWEVDARDSQLTREQYEQMKNQKPPKEDVAEQDFQQRRSEEPSAPRASYLQVLPLSTTRGSMVTSSVATPSIAINYTPIPVSDLPELVVDRPTR